VGITPSARISFKGEANLAHPLQGKPSVEDGPERIPGFPQHAPDRKKSLTGAGQDRKIPPPGIWIQDRQAAVLFQGPPGDGRHQFILVLVDVLCISPLRHLADRYAGQTHNGSVVGGHHDTPGDFSYQVVEPFAKQHSRAVVEAHHQDLPLRYALDLQQVGAAVHADGGLAGSRPGKDEQVVFQRRAMAEICTGFRRFSAMRR